MPQPPFSQTAIPRASRRSSSSRTSEAAIFAMAEACNLTQRRGQAIASRVPPTPPAPPKSSNETKCLAPALNPSESPNTAGILARFVTHMTIDSWAGCTNRKRRGKCRGLDSRSTASARPGRRLGGSGRVRGIRPHLSPGVEVGRRGSDRGALVRSRGMERQNRARRDAVPLDCDATAGSPNRPAAMERRPAIRGPFSPSGQCPDCGVSQTHVNSGPLLVLVWISDRHNGCAGCALRQGRRSKAARSTSRRYQTASSKA